LAFAVDEQIADATGLTIQFEVFTKRVKTGILKKSLSALMKKKAAKGKPPAAATEETPKEPAEKEPKAEDKEPPKEPAEKEPKAEDKEPPKEPAEKEPKAEDKEPVASAEEPPKDTAELVAAEDKLKLEAGDKVRVAFEDLLHKLRYGDSGTVLDVSSENLAVVNLVASIAPVTIPLALLDKEPTGGWLKKIATKGLVRMPMTAKIGLLLEIGIDNPLEEVIEVSKPNALMTDQAINVFCAVLRHNLGLLADTKCAYVMPLLSRFIIEDMTGKPLASDYSVASAELKAKRLRCFRNLWAEANVVLIPVFSCEAPRHWTLLALRKQSSTKAEVWYYDTLPSGHGGCKRNAALLLKALEVKETLPARCNVCRQLDVECGYLVCHYMEEHLRHHRGEGWATNVWPNNRVKDLKQNVKAWMTTLEGSRIKWAEDKLKEQDQDEKIAKAAVKAAMVALEKAGKLEALAEAHHKLALKLLEEGKGKETVPLPDGFGVKPPPTVKVAVEGAGAEPKVAAEEHPAAEEAGLELKAAATEETPKEPAEKEPKAEDKEPPKEPAEKEPKAEDKEPVASAEEVVPLAAAAPKAKGKAKARAATLKLSAEDQVAVEMATESWTEDNLRPQFRSEFAKAKGGVGVCSKCRWSSGCIRCSEDKAWSYWVRRELGFDNSKAIVAKHAKK